MSGLESLWRVERGIGVHRDVLRDLCFEAQITVHWVPHTPRRKKRCIERQHLERLCKLALLRHGRRAKYRSARRAATMSGSTTAGGGVTTAEIAAQRGPVHRNGIRRPPPGQGARRPAAELLEAEADLKPPDLAPGLLPLFPIGALTPRSECPHRGPITPGTSLCCMVCHASGFDAVGVGQGRAAPVP